MITYQVKLTDTFSNELALIIDYIENKLENRIAANNFFEKVVAAIKSLATFPYRFAEYNKKVRKTIVMNYSIFYSVSKLLKTVYILHILYNGRDISKLQL